MDQRHTTDGGTLAAKAGKATRNATSKRRAILGVGSGVHSVHDGFADLLYLLLPLWQAEFALTLTQVGLVRSVYSGAMALLQVPAGLLAERLGERILLGAGTILLGLAFIALGTADSYLMLVFILLAGGMGSTVQHPLSSSLIAGAYEHGSRRAALGIYNFAGDIGKVVVPLTVSVLIGVIGWRWAAQGAGVLAVAAGIACFGLLYRLGAGAPPPAPAAAKKADDARTGAAPAMGWGITHRAGFTALSAIGIIDGAGRTGLLTFLPFLLIGKGAEVETVGFALALVFAGGAAGKFLCGLLAERLGIIRTVVLTEAITGLGILLLLPLPLNGALALLPLIGLGLNGTSSVLYGTVSDFVAPERQSRGFGLFYTLSIGGGAVAPVVFGLLSDVVGVTVTLAVVAGMVMITLPLSALLRRPLAAAAR